MWTVRGAGVRWTRGGETARRCSAGELDSKAARQRYPEVTPAATSRQSRSASNEIRTRISIGLLADSIGVVLAVRQSRIQATTRFFPSSLARYKAASAA